MLTRDGYCTKEIKMRISIAKEAFNRKISLLTSKRNIEFMKKLVSYVWSIALYGSETWTLRKLEWNYLKNFEMWCWRRIEKIRWPKKVLYCIVFDGRVIAAQCTTTFSRSNVLPPNLDITRM